VLLAAHIHITRRKRCPCCSAPPPLHFSFPSVEWRQKFSHLSGALFGPTSQIIRASLIRLRVSADIHYDVTYVSMILPPCFRPRISREMFTYDMDLNCFQRTRNLRVKPQHDVTQSPVRASSDSLFSVLIPTERSFCRSLQNLVSVVFVPARRDKCRLVYETWGYSLFSNTRFCFDFFFFCMGCQHVLIYFRKSCVSRPVTTITYL
jgi:hypothetical protein